MLSSLSIKLTDLDCVCCAEDVEALLKSNPHIASAKVDFPRSVLDLQYHDGMLSQAALRDLVKETGRCRCEGGADYSSHDGMAHIQHVAAMAPLTMNTRSDRMQYEMAGAVHKKHATAAKHDAHAGMDHQAAGHADMGHDMSDPKMAASMERDMRNRFLLSLLLTIPTVGYSPLGMDFFALDLPTGPLNHNWLMFLLSTPVVWWGGWFFISGAVRSLRRGALNMSVLLSTGVLAAYVFSVAITIGDLGETFYEAAAMLVTFVLFGHWMEMKSRRGTSDSLRALLDLVPPTATVIRDGAEIEVPTTMIQAGDRLRLRPGEKVAVDGVIETGESSIDESLVTGESLPVDKGPGDDLIGGSINRSGSVVFRATKVGADTALARIVRLVEEAQNSKAPGQRLADKAAQYLVIVAVGSGLLTFLAWQFAFGEETLVALTFAISAVVIACPDALGLATPTAIAVGTGLGARHNILIKDAATLEGVSKVDTVVLDKTGTLTEGRPQLTDVIGLEGDFLRLAGAAEAGSEHPLAQAIVEGARARGASQATVDAFRAVAGKGVEATVEGHAVLVGNRRLLTDAGIEASHLAPDADALAERGRTPMYVAVDGRAAGLIAVADTIKPTARAAVVMLQSMGIEPVMITGDNERTARSVAHELGIERFFADVLPEDKARHVAELQAEGKVVAMVGDGVNDAPALARADIGIAIGAGTDVAIETARVVLMKSDPLDIVKAIRLSQATVRKMKQNLFWASIYNLLAIPVAAGALYPSFGVELRPEWSALLMSFSSIVVATNAVLLKRTDGELRRVGG